MLKRTFRVNFKRLFFSFCASSASSSRSLSSTFDTFIRGSLHQHALFPRRQHHRRRLRNLRNIQNHQSIRFASSTQKTELHHPTHLTCPTRNPITVRIDILHRLHTHHQSCHECTKAFRWTTRRRLRFGSQTTRNLEISPHVVSTATFNHSIIIFLSHTPTPTPSLVLSSRLRLFVGPLCHMFSEISSFFYNHHYYYCFLFHFFTTFSFIEFPIFPILKRS